MQTCDICNVEGDEVRLFDAIYDGQMAIICERCSIVENVPIIKTPNPDQLKESETSYPVHQRMKHLAGIHDSRKDETFFQEDKLKELDNNPDLEKPEKDKLNLIEHFHWEVMKHRRRKGMTQKHLAESLGESETSIQLIEKARLPDNAEIIINKLEQFFQTKLRNIPKEEPTLDQEALLKDQLGNEIDTIPEEAMIYKKPELEINQEKTIEQLSYEHAQTLDIEDEPFDQPTPSTISTEPFIPTAPSGDLDLKRIDKEKTTIGDLQRFHETRSTEIEQEKQEEELKIEKRHRILRESRERDRQIILERKKQELLEKQQAKQQLILDRQRIIEQKKQELEDIKRKEAANIDQHLGGTELLNQEDKNQEDKIKTVDEFDDELGQATN